MYLRARIVVCLVLIPVGFCLVAAHQALAGPRSGRADNSWVSEIGRDHPLVGKVWQPSLRRFAEPRKVVRVLGEAPFVLLGEKHDNEDHHRIQARLLGAMISRGRRPAVSFEMVDQTQEGKLFKHLSARPGDAAGLGEALGWSETGWPDWRLYQPIAQVALDTGLPIRPAGIARDQLVQLSRQGLGTLGKGRALALGLDHQYSPRHAADLREEIIASHCNQLPEAMIDPMVTITRVKDAVMAESLIQGARAPGADGAVLIAGAGHVRKDRGVPWHLSRKASGRRVVALALLEVVAGENNPDAYADRFDTKRLPFDFVWFTPRVDDLDPCEVFAEQLDQVEERFIEDRPK